MEAKLLKQQFVDELSSRYSRREAESLFFIFLEHYTGRRRIDFLSAPSLSLKEAEILKMQTALEGLVKGAPYQHIAGETEFAGLRLKVSKAALIPRPETEELVYLVKDRLKQGRGYRVLDVGTGSGCIALALARFFTESQVFGVDVSEAALELARENARLNELDVKFLAEDILKPSTIFDQKWEVIISNPPYIAEWEARGMDKLVTQHDPRQALFVPDDDPLRFYKAISEYGQKNLSEGGIIFLEINERLGEDTAEIYRSGGFKVELLKDMSGKDRFVVAQK